MEKILLDAKDIQKLTGLSRTTVYELFRKGDIPVISIGGRRLVHKEMFYKWLESKCSFGIKV